MGASRTTSARPFAEHRQPTVDRAWHDRAHRRVALEGASPEVDAGRFAAKGTLGDVLELRVDAFTDGHDAVAGVARWRHASDTANEWQETPLRPLGNDRWAADVPLEQLGHLHFTFAAWIDSWGSWRRDLRKRLDAEQDVALDLRIGAGLVRDAATRAAGAAQLALTAFAERLEHGGADGTDAALDDALDEVMLRHPDRANETTYDRVLRVEIEREVATNGAWYERFPRSTGASADEHGTFATLQAELPRIAAMGFDVLYLPPIHPIGREHRKGPDNAVTAGPDDPGSPWAIGAAEGGHTEILPELGTLEDFAALVDATREHGMELALDLAYQCAPDHPWVEAHPEWFRTRPDGTIQYAENPPKKYQDIYPIDFETSDWEALWLALKGVVDTWVERGVRIFRVDNPHTKAFPFWEWMIGAVRAEHPDVVFLSEAFTRPRVMHRLAKLGFSQSYTYFAWRQEKWEIEEYLRELTSDAWRHSFRPNFWPNTPDILTEQLQDGRRGTYVSRLVLAATASSSYGIYGPAFELLEGTAVKPGSEEYSRSEKYEVRHRDLDAPHSLDEVIALVNAARRDHPALHRTDTLHLHHVDNDRLIAYSKRSADGTDVVLVVVNLDPEWRQAGWLTLDLDALGITDDSNFVVQDLLGGATYTWRGPGAYIELDPAVLPAHILHVRSREHRDERDHHRY